MRDLRPVDLDPARYKWSHGHDEVVEAVLEVVCSQMRAGGGANGLALPLDFCPSRRPSDGEVRSLAMADEHGDRSRRRSRFDDRNRVLDGDGPSRVTHFGYEGLANTRRCDNPDASIRQ